MTGREQRLLLVEAKDRHSPGKGPSSNAHQGTAEPELSLSFPLEEVMDIEEQRRANQAAAVRVTLMSRAGRSTFDIGSSIQQDSKA